jgi:hypothetical protein
VFVAQENLRRAEEHFRFSERLANKNYITAVQLDADRFAVKKAAKDLEVATSKLQVLQVHTYKKMVAQLKGEIDKAQALLTAAERSVNLEQQHMRDLEDQIAKCRVVAPVDGQVVYATQADRGRDEQIIIEEGAIIREGQTVIRLPDSRRMQVRAMINESRINFVKVGLPARIELDSDPDSAMEGIVTQVDAFPISKRWSSSIKEYGAVVKIMTPVEKLRPGLRARVRIHVHGENSVMQVPVQAIVEHQGTHYCLKKNGDGWEPKAVELGPNNDRFVIVRGGIADGDQVTIDPRQYLQSVEFPAAAAASDVAGGRSRPGEAVGQRKSDRRAHSGG